MTREETVDINGLALAEICKRTGITQAALAADIGKDPSYVGKMLNGQRRQVSVSTYRRILSALVIKDWRTLLANPYAAPAEPPTLAAVPDDEDDEPGAVAS